MEMEASRPIVPQDLPDLRSAHEALFPIDYESHFYECVIYNRDQIFSWAAVSRDPTLQHERLIGFVTARTFRLYDCSIADRACMGLESRLLDQEDIIYILTLGVTEQFRHLGVASQLIQKVIQYAKGRLCRSVYLHVIDYNEAALNLYAANKFEVLATLRNFYHIDTGRQPDPERTSYDAYLYAFLIDVSLNASPLAFLSATCAPVRSLLGQLQSCMPWARHQSNYFSQAVRQRTYGPIKPVKPAAPSQQHGGLLRMFNRA
ncbi:hypothetical protein ABBQ38_007274 [Trebouxia sp. C0009 RCD-2024]